jgi:sialate O-acetylesterase
MKRIAFVAFALLVLTAPLSAAVKPHELFTDHMVLQAGREIPVWGTASVGEQVTVELTIGKDTIKVGPVEAGNDGKWMVKLPAQVATAESAPSATLVIKGNNEVILEDVLIGEVWICSGQSNMEWSVKASYNSEKTIEAADDQRLRLYTVPKTASAKPLAAVAKSPKWRECSSETVPSFSAVAYFFGKNLRETRKVPVGLIHTSWGGTPAQAWTSQEALDAEPSLKYYHERLAQAVKGYDPKKADDQYKTAMDKWKTDAEKAKAEGKTPPRQPVKQQPPALSQYSASTLYNGMIAPLLPFAIRGAIWYQGESNAGQAYEYRTLFPAMIKDWRTRWNQGDFPFLFVQLAPFGTTAPWPELREAQLLTTKTVPNAAMAVITDVGDEKDIHPKKKQPVGERLAIAARALAYDEKIEFSGPVFESMKVEGNKVILTFAHVGDGLKAEGELLKGFVVCGEDKKFVPAKATITGQSTIEVTCNAVEKPIAVRYGWENFPIVNLWNKAGLPATPFRTDDFPSVTQPKKQ